MNLRIVIDIVTINLFILLWYLRGTIQCGINDGYPWDTLKDFEETLRRPCIRGIKKRRIMSNR